MYLYHSLLVNRESLPRASEFDGELLGNCDEIVEYLCHRLDWEFEGKSNLEEISLEQLNKNAQIKMDERIRKSKEMGPQPKPKILPVESTGEPEPKLPKIVIAEEETKIVPIEADPNQPDIIETKENPMLGHWQSRWKPKIEIEKGFYCKLDSNYQTLFYGVELDAEEGERNFISF